MESSESRPSNDVARLPRRNGRLLVLSNRVALPGLLQPGGVASALNDALRSAGGVWIGWSGKRSDVREPRHQQHGNIEYITLDLSADEHRGFYLDFANRTLWPLLHSRADLLEHDVDAAATYRRVNRRFAEVLCAVAEPGDTIWVHDYHFLTLASELRRLGIGQPLGMFLHTPFPSPDIAEALPRHRELFGALADFDLVGLQTQRDVDHLRRYLRRARPATARQPDLGAFPIGIDPQVMREHSERAASTIGYRQLRESLVERQLVVGVDRLDYSKGLPNRFEAYGNLLRRHRDLLRRVSYLQVAPVSRGEVPEYKQLKARLDALAGSINGELGDVDWVPLRYVARSYKQSTLGGIYRAASVGLVTPLRDGMNLVAKEFVAAQDPADPGVLVLSEFAGAAEQLDAALLVNPYDISGMADILASALRMPLPERRQRWQRLMAVVEQHDVSAWWRAFLDALGRAARRPQLAVAEPANGFVERRAVPRTASLKRGP